MEKLNINVLVLDDDPSALSAAKNALSHYVPAERVACCSDAPEALALLAAGGIELVFLDIEMADTHGFSVAEHIARKNPDVKLVFLSGHVELGAESFEYAPLDFLSKPINVVRLGKTMERFQRSRGTSAPTRDRIAVETAEGFTLLSPGDIRYISKEGRRSVIHTKTEAVAVSGSLDELEAVFSDYDLVRTHQSFLVPFREVASLGKEGIGKTHAVTLKDGTRVPVSRSRYAAFRAELERRGVKIL